MKSSSSWGIAAAAAVCVCAALALPGAMPDSGGGPGAAPAPGDGSVKALALNTLPIGAEPRDGYLAGAEFHNGAASASFTLEPGTEVTELAAMYGGYLLSFADDLGNQRVRFVSDDGSISRTWGVDQDSFFPTLVVSGDRELGAFVQIGGKSVVVQDGGRTVTELRPPEGAVDIGFAPVAVTGTDCTGAAPDCSVLLHGLEYTGGTGTRATTWTVRPGRSAATDRKGIGEVRTVAANGFAAGTVKIIEDGDGSCAGVADARKSVLWTTCKDRLLSFSPDSKWVLASTSTVSGSGDHELTVFDARSGEERLRLKTARNVGIFEMVWEDDDHVLAVISDWKVDPDSEDHADPRWAVVRISLDGSREYAVAPVAGQNDDFDGPLDLPQG